MPRVSAIIPAYNAAGTIRKCLSSLATQTYKDIEIIAVNDGSTDRTLDVMQECAEQYGNIRIIDSDNRGAGGARNRGTDVASGEFIKYLDADDYLKPESIEKMLNVAVEHKAGFVRGKYMLFKGPIDFMPYSGNFSGISGNQVIDVRENKDFIVTELPGVGNKFMRRDVVGDIRFPERTKWEDLGTTPAILAKAERVYSMDEPICNYRISLNTTLREYLVPFSNVLDIFKCIDLVKLHLRNAGILEEYEQQIKGLLILHSVMVTGKVMNWVTVPYDVKKQIINLIINQVELDYPDWSQSKYLEMYAKYNGTFKEMTALPKYLDSSMRCESSKENIRRNVSGVFEQSGIGARTKK